VGGSPIWYSGGYVGIGTGMVGPLAPLDLEATVPSAAMILARYTGSSSQAPTSLPLAIRTARGTSASPSAVEQGDILGAAVIQGYDGTAVGTAGQIIYWADQNWTSSQHGSYLTISTVADGTTSATERMRIDNAGNVGIGTTTPPMPLTISPSYAGAGAGLGIGWNHLTGGTGETDFYNYAGGGPGGFVFYNYYAPGAAWPSGSPTELMLISSSGVVGIGTTDPCANGQAPQNCKLSVAGAIQAYDITVNNQWSDYVFDPSYRLAPLSEVDDYIQQNHHLPDIPSAREVQEKGVSLGEMQAKLLAKVEELTLHMIQAEKENQELRERIARLEERDKR